MEIDLTNTPALHFSSFYTWTCIRSKKGILVCDHENETVKESEKVGNFFGTICTTEIKGSSISNVE